MARHRIKVTFYGVGEEGNWRRRKGTSGRTDSEVPEDRRWKKTWEHQGHTSQTAQKCAQTALFSTRASRHPVKTPERSLGQAEQTDGRVSDTSWVRTTGWIHTFASSWNSKALQIAVKRREAKSKGEKERYKHLNAEFPRIARRDKKAFFSDQCKEIEENNRMGEERSLQEN